MISSAKKSIQVFIQQCIHFGLTQFVVSPGSRNAPLIIALNQHPTIQTTVIPDERVAAFYALGMAQQLNQPVGIVCTSGSAPLNYYPAIAEAYYQHIPLVVVSADRPSAWTNQGDGQTIVQENVFSNHIRYSVTLPENIQNSTDSWYLSREISHAFDAANGLTKGPIHFNFPFTEPLYEQVQIDEETIDFKAIEKVEIQYTLGNQQIDYLKNTWETITKKLIIVGQHRPDHRLLNALKDLSNDTSVAILVENTSNLVDPGFIHCIDRTLNLITPEQMEEFAPELLITMGDAVVSKKIKAFIRNHPPKQHWKIGFNFPFMDTYQSLTHTFEVASSYFIATIVQHVNFSNSNYGAQWQKINYISQDKSQQYLLNNPVYSDLTVFHTLLDFIPENSHLHMANSSVIRYCQLFDPVKSINYWCNRGTSGIDGSTSTACGAASITKETWHTLITGDMSFFYDSNAFWHQISTPNLRIFMINNAGGSIFKIIPGPSSTQESDDFFVYSHQFSAEYICKAYNVSYFKATSLTSIEEQMEAFYQYDEAGGPALMEIFTDSALNPQELAKFWSEIK